MLRVARCSKSGMFCLWVAAFFLFHSDVTAQGSAAGGSAQYFVNCSADSSGDGSKAHPWNHLADAEAHIFVAGDVIALARGTECHGSFAPRGSGTEGHVIRLTAYGEGLRPRIVAANKDRQALLLNNLEYWQIDSLDISGGNKYGIFVTGDQGPLHHIYLKNLYVHHVYGGALKNKDNGLIIVGPSSMKTVFSDVLIDGVDAAHTNQWSGILLGGGPFPYKNDSPLNEKMVVRNSTAHDIYGDGIILFRDQHSLIETSSVWEMGMQATQDVGTPNAIWTWTCMDCIVQDNEAYLTDSPGVDGGAYDIDWNNTQNTVQRNFGHETQGYCIAVLAAGYTTKDSIVNDNLCINNGLSPRLSGLQGAIYLHMWNEGHLHGLRLENNTIFWNPPVSGAAAIVSDALYGGVAPVIQKNHIVSSSPLIYRSTEPWASSENTYATAGTPAFTVENRKHATLDVLQSAGMEKGSVSVSHSFSPSKYDTLKIEAALDLTLDADGLISSATRAQLLTLRSFGGQYGSNRLQIVIHLRGNYPHQAESNALRDLEDVYPGVLRFDHEQKSSLQAGELRIHSADGNLAKEWHGFVNAATLGGTLRELLGAPQYSHQQALEERNEQP